LMLAGCSYTKPALVAPMALGPKETPVAIVHGSAGADYFFGFNVGGEDTLAAAIEDAKLHSPFKGDTLANVFVDQSIACFPACSFPIIESVAVHVTGTLIKYEGMPAPVPAVSGRSRETGTAF
jgi:hypothetical protein